METSNDKTPQAESQTGFSSKHQHTGGNGGTSYMSVSTPSYTAAHRRRNREAAFWYIERGLSIIPVGTDKKPLVRWSEFTHRLATKDEIIGWFRQFHEVNIAIVTGAVSGISVVDIDTPRSLDQKPTTWACRTPRGGFHLYYRYDENAKTRAGVREHLDVRSDGGYVVCPPSVNTNGAYAWITAPWEQTLDMFPRSLLRGSEKAKTASEGATRLKDSVWVKSGRRNEMLHRAATLLLNHLDTDTAWRIVLAVNATYEPPMEEDEVRALFASASSFVSRNPGKLHPHLEEIERLLKTSDNAKRDE